MKKEIQKLVQQAIQSHYGIDFGMEKIKVDYPPDGMGDFSTNVAMILAKKIGENPVKISEELKEKIFRRRTSKSGGDFRYPEFAKIEIAKPGFINFWLADDSLQYMLVKINREKEKYGSSEIGAGKKIHLDFVSANPTGPVHVGNARGGPLGDTLANVFEKVSYKTYREYYVNDAGNQVEILGHSILGDSEAQYRGEYIADLSSRLRVQTPKLFTEKNVRKIGEEGVKIIMEEIIKPSMEKFGIKFDNYFSEKELQKSGKVDEVLKILEEKNFIYKKEGALWFKSTLFGDDKDRVVVKSDGEKTYFGSDIAYHKEKLDRGFNRLIDIWGADHHGEVKRTLGALEALGYKNKLDIILTQLVRVIKGGKEIKMSKRAGTYVSINDLIDEVGRDATRFFFLMHSAGTHMNFDLDLARDKSEKNPVYYVQYAYARIASILRKAEGVFSGEAKFPQRKLSFHPKERVLILELLKFPDLIEDISQNYAVHQLPQYVIGLADKFHNFYEECRVIDGSDPESTMQRLKLVKAVRVVLAEALKLMGISAPERM